MCEIRQLRCGPIGSQKEALTGQQSTAEKLSPFRWLVSSKSRRNFYSWDSKNWTARFKLEILLFHQNGKKHFSSNTYSWPRLVCRRKEELFSRPFVDQNEFRFNSNSESYSAWECNRQLFSVSWVILPHLHPHLCTAHWCPSSPDNVGNTIWLKQCKYFFQFQCQLSVLNNYKVKCRSKCHQIWTFWNNHWTLKQFSDLL